ncbi:MAG: tyrosine-type recombinase/integrase, partial [Pseudomonadota bacterium]|nr:tyrosine-type recombinase/integrase [Pseudomonadota bacterium]
AWNRVRRRSGVENFRFHDLRHEAISELIERADHYGLSLPEVMFISGHKTLSMVTRYYHALAPRIAKKLAR